MTKDIKPEEVKLKVHKSDYDKTVSDLSKKGYIWMSTEEPVHIEIDSVKEDMEDLDIHYIYLYIVKEWKTVEYDFEDDKKVKITKIEQL